MSVLSKVTLPNGNSYDLKGVVNTVTGTQSSSTAAWIGTTTLTELVDGTTIAYYLPRTSKANATLKLTLAGGTDTDAIPVYFKGDTRVGTEYVAGSLIILTYYSAGSISINGVATSDARWVVNSPYTNTTTDTKVTQTETATDATYEVLFSGSASGAGTKTEASNKNTALTYNPSSETLTTTNISATTINGVTVGSTPEFTDTTYSGGTGISIGTGNAINHSNSITAQSTQAVYPIKYDAQGHITGAGSAVTLGTAASKGVATSITSSSTDDDLATAKAVYTAIDNLPEPMQFKGTVGDSSSTVTWTNLATPSASNEGWTYKATSARTTSQTSTLTQDVKIGDTIISNSTNWVVIPSGDEPSGTVTSVNISASNTAVVVGGGPVTSSGTLTVGHADTSSASSVVAEAGKFINAMTVDDYGHVTAISTATATTTDVNVTQTPASTTNADYRVLLSHSANDTEETAGVYKDTDLKYNPSTNSLSVTKINGQTVGSSPKFTDTDTETTVSFTKSNGTGTFKQSKSVSGGTATETTIFTTTDTNVGSASNWSAGDYPLTASVSGETLTFSNGTKPSLTVTSVTNLAKVNTPT
jgi:hypothetical protein